MLTSVVLTVIGPDRPGLVETLSETISDHGGNWVESRMAHLAGQFAGLLLLTVPTERTQTLRDDLHALAKQGMHITVEVGESGEVASPQLHHLEVMGHDRPGLIRDLTRALRERGINVEELESECTSAPMSGEPMFRARLTLSIPPETDVDELNEALEQLAERLLLDLVWEPTSAGDVEG